MSRLLFVPIFAAALLMSCALEPLPAEPPSPSRATFDVVVYPILARDCGFPACHGASERFFRVFGPGRARLDEATTLSEPATAGEMLATYERARSMLSGAESAEYSLLVRKPLEVDQGGAPHMGVDQHGRDVYATTDAAGYVTLLEWARAGGLTPLASEDEGAP